MDDFRTTCARPTLKPGELLDRIPAATRRRQYFPGLFAFGLDYLGYFACSTAACLVPTWWGKSLCCLLGAFAIGGLFIVGHDAAHSSLVPSRRLNRLLARLAFLPAYVPLTTWRYNHNVLHHRFLRVRGRDPVWQPWSLEEYRSRPRWQRAGYYLLRTPFGLPIYWAIHNWMPRYLRSPRPLPPGDRAAFRFDRLCIVAFLVGMYAWLRFATRTAAGFDSAYWEPVGPLGIVGWVLVGEFLMWSWLIGFVDWLQHTHPRSIWFASSEQWDYTEANLRSTTHVLLPFGLNNVWHYILEHTAHHVDPRVPLYRLRRAQDALEQAFPDDVLVERLTPAYLWRLWQTCRLYDFDRRQWLDYDGSPTAPAQAAASTTPPEGLEKSGSAPRDAALHLPVFPELGVPTLSTSGRPGRLL
jgi:omega-6 fatty acid desaturase (delta-12 desaturase)